MAAVLAASASRLAFLKMWRLMGRPTLRVIAPVSQWVLPVGVVYDAYTDQFVNGAGQAVVIDPKVQTGTDYQFLPLREDHAVRLAIPGVTTTDTSSVILLWSSVAETAVKHAWGVLLSGRLYRVYGWTLEPPGVARPVQITVELREGE